LKHGGQFGRLCERFEIGADKLSPRRKNIGRRRLPAVTIEERRRGTVNAIAPGREDADMSPVAQVRADHRAGLIDLHRQTARDQMRSRSEADRTASDHGDGKMFEHGVCHILSFQHYRN